MADLEGPRFRLAGPDDAKAVVARSEGTGLYVWVLEQNVEAQAFYEARGGRCVERDRVSPPGGIASRVTGSPVKLRFAWPEPAVLLTTRRPLVRRLDLGTP